MQRELLIVGAGLTGSLTASLLARSSRRINITVWDKAGGCGGRFTTSRSSTDPSLHVDMGAQYISRCLATQRSGEYKEVKGGVYQELLESSTLAPFNGSIEGGRQEEGTKNYIAPGGMSSVCKYFLNSSKATMYYKSLLASIDIEQMSVEQPKLVCQTDSGQEAKFDAVVLTLPAPQLLQLGGRVLSQIDPQTRSGLSTVRFSSRYALGLFFNADAVLSSPATFESSWTAKYFDDQVVRYVCWDNLKRGLSDKQAGATLLIHTNVQFGAEHLDMDKNEVKALISQRLEKLIPGLPQPTHSYVLRWRYSQVWDKFPGSCDYLVLSRDPLVVATGDSFSGSNFDNCLRAALATSKCLLDRCK